MRYRQVLAGVLLVLAVAGIAAWVFVKVTDDDEVGRTFAASAAVRDDCQSLIVRVDGFSFNAVSGLPIEWRGKTVLGTVEVTEDHGSDDLVAIFTDGDGRTAKVEGSKGGTRFSNAACGIWPSES